MPHDAMAWSDAARNNRYDFRLYRGVPDSVGFVLHVDHSDRLCCLNAVANSRREYSDCPSNNCGGCCNSNCCAREYWDGGTSSDARSSDHGTDDRSSCDDRHAGCR